MFEDLFLANAWDILFCEWNLNKQIRLNYVLFLHHAYHRLFCYGDFLPVDRNNQDKLKVKKLPHRVGRTRISDLLVINFIMVVYENLFLKFSINFVSKVLLKFTTVNHYRTIFESVRSAFIYNLRIFTFISMFITSMFINMKVDTLFLCH